MKLYLLTQHDNTSYDTYDSCIVAATDAGAAKLIQPGGTAFAKVLVGDFWYPTYARPEEYGQPYRWGDWAYGPAGVEAEYIGEAKEGTEAGVILASFNAG